jgi:hypothetical protein
MFFGQTDNIPAYVPGVKVNPYGAAAQTLTPSTRRESRTAAQKPSKNQNNGCEIKCKVKSGSPIPTVLHPFQEFFSYPLSSPLVLARFRRLCFFRINALDMEHVCVVVSTDLIKEIGPWKHGSVEPCFHTSADFL